jgi:glycosyltransferase involved in cell wall biosynthesis
MSLKKERKIDCGYGTFPLASTLVVGSKIKREMGIPFVAEFRDGLTIESLLPMYEKIRKQAEALETDIFREADRIVAVTCRSAEMYREKYGRSVDRVYNGFDPEDFRLVGRRKLPDNRHDMVLFGSILASRSTKKRIHSYVNFMGGIKVLKEKGVINKENFSLSFVGRSVPDERDLAKQFKLTELINFFEPMPKEEGLAWVASSFDSLLEFGSPGDSGVVCGKLLEYINLGMPIFGICKGSESEDIISRTRTGLVCGFGLEDVANGLIQFLQGDYVFDPDREKIDQFSRVRLTVQVAEVIKAACP